MIELENVVKSYGAGRVVDDVSLTVETGKFCVLLGSSGSGKTTTLKMINRLIPLSGGSIRVGGEDVSAVAGEMLRRRIGYAIQSIGLFPHWTIADNIATVPRLLQWQPRRIAVRVRELLELFQLDPGHYGGKYPHQLSGGQQQRVGVARALAADPDILLMDEPFGAVDPLTRIALRTELARIQKATGKTVVFVTHDIDEALVLADVIAIMHQGKLVQFGPPAEILERPANDFVRDFVGRAELGLKLLSVRHVGEKLRPGEVSGGDPISASETLKEALSQMIVRHAAQLPVRDADGTIAGTVQLSDMVS
jgi:osmoprotectant transport system ATP-binding protein